MDVEMRAIRQVSAMSLARVAAIYYALGGLLTLIVDLAMGMEKLTVPFGFFTLFLGLKLNFTYSRALWIPGILSQLFFSTILYALTGGGIWFPQRDCLQLRLAALERANKWRGTY